MTGVVLMRGVLGWGNRKGGLEAYGPDGRWGGEGAYRDHGDLLGDALDRAGATEGAALIVVAVDRPAQADDDGLVDRLQAAVSAALAGP